MINVTELLGVPFMDKGRDRNVGLDCYGLVKEVYKQNGVLIPEYGEVLTDEMTAAEMTTNSNWEPIPEPKEPCLIAIRFGSPRGVVNHVGVYIGDGRFVHTRIKKGVCIDKVNSIAWRNLIEGYYRYTGG